MRSLMTRSGLRPTVPDAPANVDLARAVSTAAPPVAASRSMPLRSLQVSRQDPLAGPAHSTTLATEASAAPATTSSAPAMRSGPDRTTWERLVIAPDVELHVRRPLDRQTNKRVDQLERIARELFEDP